MNTFENRRTVHNQAGVQNFHGTVHFGADIESDTSQKEDKNILGSLAFPEMLDRRSSVKQPHPGSCDWILDHSRYVTWNNASRGLLWIKGKPGSGKSTLMAFLYDRLQEQRQTERGLYLNFFFSARGAELQRTPLGMLRSLLNQLFAHDVHVRPKIRGLYREKCIAFGRSTNTWQWQQAELERLLQDSIATSALNQAVSVFIDALDEAGERSARELVKFFHQLNRSTHLAASVKICISCRHFPVLPMPQGFEVCMEQYNKPAIAAYVDQTLSVESIEGMGNISHQDFEAWKNLKDDLVRHARGVFQWIRIVTLWIEKSVSEGESITRIRDRVRQVSHELKDIYEYIFVNVIEQQNYSRSLLLFRWVCLARRPLSVIEVHHIMTAEYDPIELQRREYRSNKATRKSGRMIEAQLKTWSGGLVEVVPAHDPSSAPLVQVIHQSVNEYLLTDGLAWLASNVNRNTPSQLPDISSDSRSDMARYQATLYKSCLDFVIEPGLSEEGESSDDPLLRLDVSDVDLADRLLNAYDKKDGRKVFEHYPMLEYAAMYVFVHAQKSSDIWVNEVAQESQLLLAIPLWMHIRDDRKSRNRSLGRDTRTVSFPRQGTELIHVAAFANMMTIMKGLSDNGVDLDAVDDSGFTALHIAAGQGHRRLVEFLLEAGANPRAENAGGKTPLSEAVGSGHFQIVVDLLQPQHIEENSTDGLGGALEVASRNGDLAMARLLVRTGGSLRPGDGVLEEALVSACHNGHTQVVEFLVRSGADLEYKNPLLGTALHAALDQKRSGKIAVAITKILLIAGANIEVHGGQFVTALHTASVHNHHEVVALLSSANADMNECVAGIGTALMCASSHNTTRSVRALIKAGADVNFRTPGGKTALYKAVSSLNSEVLAILLQSDADINLATGSEKSLLAVVVDVLISRERNWSRDIVGSATQVIKILLEAGADPDAGFPGDCNILQMVCMNKTDGYLEIVRLLLAAGADVNAPPGRYGTALQAACSSKWSDRVERRVYGRDPRQVVDVDPVRPDPHGKIVRLLLSAGADVNAHPGGDYGFALYNACLRGTEAEEFVRMLLAADANVDERAGPKGTAFHALVAAAGVNAGGFGPVMSMLIAAGGRFLINGEDFNHILQKACWNNVDTVIDEVIRQGVKAQIMPQYYDGALLIASSRGNQRVVNKLLDMGADVNFRSDHLGTALQAASWIDESGDLVTFLLQKGADVSIFGGQHGSALHAAVSSGRAKIVSILLEAGADVNACCGANGSALLLALRESPLVTVEDDDASVSDTDSDCSNRSSKEQRKITGRRLWERAKECQKIIQLLLEAGVNADSQHAMTGLSALQYAVVRGMRRTARALLDAGADVNLQSSASEGPFTRELCLMVHDLFGEGANVTALKVASREGDVAMVQDLLDAGADVNLQCGKLGTALQVASSQRDVAMVQHLLDAGADVNASSEQYGSALQAACGEPPASNPFFRRSRERARISIVRTLLKAGANPNLEGGTFGNALTAACASGSLRVVQLLLRAGATVNGTKRQNTISTLTGSPTHPDPKIGSQDEVYSAPLHHASARQDQKMVRMLLREGADVNLRTGKHGTALQSLFTVRGGNTKSAGTIARIFVDAGADVNATGGEYGSALHAAALFGNLNSVRLLIGLGADVNLEAGKYGSVIQAAACASGDGFETAEIILVLLAAGAKVNAASGKFGYALQAAASHCAHSKQRVVDLLLDRGADVNMEGGEYGTALQAAAAEDRSGDLVAKLLEAGANVNYHGGIFGNALQAACHKGTADSVDLLLKARADPNAKGGLFVDALQAAIASLVSSHRKIRLLLDAGADLKVTSDHYGTALHMAAARQAIMAVRLCLQAGANVKLTAGPYGSALQAAAASAKTPSMFADRRDMVWPAGNDWQIIEELIEAGADVNAVGGKYGSALHAAVSVLSSRKHGLIRSLLAAGADVNLRAPNKDTVFQAAVSALSSKADGCETVFRLLLDAGADTNARQWETGGTALHIAMNARDKRTVQLLLRAHADPDLCDFIGQSPLHIAAQNGMTSVVQQLCELEVDLSSRDDFGRTPLHLAIYHAHFNTASCLISFGADVSIKDGYGRSPLAWADGYLDQIGLRKEMMPNTDNEHGNSTFSALRQSICELSDRLLRKRSRRTRPGFDELGHCLIFTGNLDDARFCFQQQVLSRGSKTGRALHDVVCRACHQRPTDRPIAGPRFVCQMCPDVNLCFRCKHVYHRRKPNQACWDHIFLEIDGLSNMAPGDEQDASISDETRQWLQELAERFAKHDDLQTQDAGGLRKRKSERIEDADEAVVHNSKHEKKKAREEGYLAASTNTSNAE